MSLFDIFQSSLLNNSIAFTNSYIIWKSGIHHERAMIEFSLENLPFSGNVIIKIKKFCFVGGINEIIDLISNFEVKENDIRFLK